MKVKITQIEQDWMALQPFHQQHGWQLEVSEDVAKRWDSITKSYIGMQYEIDSVFHQQNPKSEHFT